MIKIAITGAGGFIGSRLRDRFPAHVIIDRHDSTRDIKEKLGNVSTVINLAGAPIIRRWTEAYKAILWDSRVNTTKKLVHALNSMNSGIHLISASATGIYPQGRSCDETCRDRSDDFLGRLAAAWEQEALAYSGDVTLLRLGVVLGPEGGALSMMLPLFRMGLGGPIGKGDMVMSWIDIEDLLRAIEFVIERRAKGVFNAVSPQPVTNLDFTRELARILRRPAVLPVPPLMLRLVYGEAAVVLAGSWEVYPERLGKSGFRFKYPEMGVALRHLLGQQ